MADATLTERAYDGSVAMMASAVACPCDDASEADGMMVETGGEAERMNGRVREREV